MSNTTHGATRQKLIENGYAPIAANREFGFLPSDEPGAVLLSPAYQSDCGGLKDFASRRLVVLAVVASAAAVRSDILKVLAVHGVGKSICRVGSDSSELYFVRFDNAHGLPPQSYTTKPVQGEHDPAFALLSHSRKLDGVSESALVRLDGTWKNGDLLTTPRSKLPSLDFTAISSILAEVEAVLNKSTPKVEYVLPPVNLQAKAERLRIEAELAKRTDETVWQIVAERSRSASSFGISEWERAASRERAESPENRIAVYDEIVAEAKARRRA
jgi:hypothetical protein